MMVPVHSSQLQFTRDGGTLVVAGPDGVALLDAGGDGQRRVAVAGVHAVAAFADQVWVTTRAGRLIRLGLDGRRLDDHALPHDPDGCLIPAMIGGPAALWAAREPALLLDDLGSLAVTAGPSDAAIPIAGRRFARHAGSRLSLPAGTTVMLPGATKIVGGCVIFDGTSLALVTEQPRGHDIVIVALASGRTRQTVALPPGPIRIAARRGLAVVQDAVRRLSVLDLRFARRLGAVLADDDVVDVAVDPDGQRLAIRLACGELELAPVGDRMRAGSGARASTPDAGRSAEVPGVTPDEVGEVAPVEAPAPSGASTGAGARASRLAAVRPSEPEPACAARPVLPPLVVEALDPRPTRDRLPRAAALAELDRELRSVMLWTLRAISGAWDSRRLGYGNEGHHPYEHEVAALVGKNAGFASDYLAAARDALAEHEAALAADPQHRASPTPIAELIDELGLSAVAIDVLLVIAAPALDGDVARMYGILGNDPGRAMVDELLVQHVLAERVSRHDVAAELHPRAPLVRLGIVDVKPSRPRPFAALEVDPVVLSRLRGELPALGAAPVVRPADRDLDAIELAPGVLLSAIEALARATRPARIAIRGRAGSGRRTLLAALAQRAGRSLGAIDAAILPRDAERFTDALRLALRRAQLAGLIPVVHGLEAVVFHDQRGGDVARDALAAHPGPLAVLCPPDARPPLPLGHAVIDLPALSETERLGVWQRALAGTGRWLRDVTGLAARYRVGPGVVHRAVAATAADHDPTAPCDDHIDGFLRQCRDLRLADHARRVDRLARWSDLVLPSDVMDSLRELVGRVRHRRTVFDDWGMSRTLATSRGLTALFQGQPGTGKTLVAGVIARELGLDLYQVDLSKIMSKWIGETERNLATIFDAAEDGQVILLFDEADSLFAKRTEVRSSNDRYANLEVNYLLQRLDAFEGIAILTTNSGGSIDPAFKRRLSFRLSFPFPDEDTRAELWRAHLPPELPRAGELTFDALAHKYQLSGGYIRNACLRAAFLAAQEETALHQHHLERAVALEFAELGKLSTTGTVA
jgi:hypothetical protein